MSDTELLPCPFCNGRMSHYSVDGEGWWSHPTWGDRLAEDKNDLICCPAYAWRAWDTETEFLAAWNRRAPSQQEGNQG
jgi:hypothetical protein